MIMSELTVRVPTVAVYTVVFKFSGDLYLIDVDGMSDVLNGFWVDETIEFTTGIGNEKYWIPPHMITHIELSYKEINS